MMIQQPTFGEYSFAIDSKYGKLPKINVKIAGTTTEFIIGTGSTLNIIDSTTFGLIKTNSGINLSEPIANVFAFDSKQPLSFAGRLNARVETPRSSAKS